MLRINLVLWFILCCRFFCYASEFAPATKLFRQHPSVELLSVRSTPESSFPALSEFLLGGFSLSRVFNGKSVQEDYDIDRYQYFVLAFADGYTCGGSLIADNVVLTAAHCAGILKVNIGIYNLTSTSSTYEEFQVLKQIYHPNFNYYNYDNDYMILVLDGRSSHIPVCIANENTELNLGKKLHVLGFGETETTAQSQKLMETDLKFIDNDQCKKSYHNFYLVSDNMICTDSSDEGKDACQGDSGGPLIIKGNSSVEDILVGLVSWGSVCAKYPGVYSSVGAKIDWIRTTVLELGGILRECSFVSTSPISKNPTPAPTSSTSKEPKCSDEHGPNRMFATNRSGKVQRDCKWVGSRAELKSRRCKIVNLRSGRKYEDHCPKTCNNCGNSVTDNLAYRDNFCINFVRQKKWSSCQVIAIRANCPVTCSCVPETKVKSHCMDEERLETCDCKTFHGKKLCAKTCGICDTLPIETCPIEDRLKTFFLGKRWKCSTLKEKRLSYKEKACKTVSVRAQCPNACSGIAYT